MVCNHVLQTASSHEYYKVHEKTAGQVLFNLITLLRLQKDYEFLLTAALKKLNVKRTVTYG